MKFLPLKKILRRKAGKNLVNLCTDTILIEQYGPNAVVMGLGRRILSELSGIFVLLGHCFGRSWVRMPPQREKDAEKCPLQSGVV